MGRSRGQNNKNSDEEKPVAPVTQLVTKTKKSGREFLVDLLEKYDSGEITDYIYVGFFKDGKNITAFTTNSMSGRLELSGRLLAMATQISTNDFGNG